MTVYTRECIIDGSFTTTLYAFKLMSFGISHTLLAYTSESPLMETARTCINGIIHIRESSPTIMYMIISAIMSPIDFLIFILYHAPSYTIPSSPISFENLSAARTRTTPTSDWNKPTAVAML